MNDLSGDAFQCGTGTELKTSALRATERTTATCCKVKESVKALTVTLEVRRYREVALNVVVVQIWLFTFPPPLYSVKKCLYTLYDVKKCLTRSI